MRLTRASVRLVQGAVQAATGQQWLQIGGGDAGNGTRYGLTQTDRTYFGGSGAASVLSYLLGVAEVYEVAGSLCRENEAVHEVWAYLGRSGRTDGNAYHLGKAHALKARERKTT
jgi:hypothetical protein